LSPRWRWFFGLICELWAMPGIAAHVARFWDSRCPAHSGDALDHFAGCAGGFGGGLLESLLTAQVLDELTETSSDKNRECRAQGMANCVAGFFGGMGGCAMIGQSIINFKSGGRGRLSSFAAGAFSALFHDRGRRFRQANPDGGPRRA
jgi:hypothetical protein